MEERGMETNRFNPWERELSSVKKEVLSMKKSEKARFGIFGILMAMVMMGLSLTLVPIPSQAAVNCSTVTSGSTTDTDGDGFKDYHECYGGITTKGSQPTPIYGKTNCPSTGSPICLDPDNKNLFVIIVPSTYFPNITNPLEFVSKPLSQGGLGIRVHLINPNQADALRVVTSASPQKAVKITESLDISSPNVLGYSQTGTPQGLDNATIYTQRIINFLNSKYSPNPVPPGLTENYIKHTLAHEVGHMLGPLAPVYNANFGGYHNQSGTNVIMDQSVYYTAKENGDVTFYIGTGYTTADQSSFKLK